MADYGGFAYDSDYYGDDLPFWMKVQNRRQRGAPAHRALPRWTATTCALRCPGLFARRPVLSVPEDTFDALYAEGDPAGDNAPKMMSIGMHCRLLGRPGRITALQRFLTTLPSTTRCGWRGASTLPAIGHSTTPPRLYEPNRPPAPIQ